MDPHVVAEAVRKRGRLPQAARQVIGERLAMGPRDRHAATQTAKILGQTPRNLRKLRAQVRKGPLPPLGRRPIGEAERMRVRELVRAEWQRQGSSAGGRPILQALRKHHKKLSRHLVIEQLALIKAEASSKATHAIEAARVGLEVLGKDTMWVGDTSHMGRLAGGAECAGEHIKDRGTWFTLSLTVGAPPTAEDVLRDLRRCAQERGGYPLVMGFDNGSIYLAQIVRDALEQEHVIVLLSRVHTPTDNPAIEHGHGEVKSESGLGKGVVLPCHEAAQARLEPAVERLNCVRLRPSRGWHTAAELEELLPRADACVNRTQFYERARAAMKAAVLGVEDPAAARLAEREAVITTLCEFGLARRRVGRAPRVGQIPMPVPALPSGNAGEKS